MNYKNLLQFSKGIFENIGLIYFFILPVYFPVRALGLEMQSYSGILKNDTNLILFFSQVTILLAFVSIILSFFSDYINKKFIVDDLYIVHAYRAVALVLSIVFILSSYFILNPSGLFQLYFISGIHYFIISFYQLLIRSEINEYKTNKLINIAQANNYFGFCLNLAGIISVLIFSYFYSKINLITYSKYCLILEVTFFCYFLFIRKYYKDFQLLLSKIGFFSLSKYFSYFFLALIISALASVIIMSVGVIIPILTIYIIGYIYVKFKKDIQHYDLKLLINIALGYGLILSILTGSILIYFFHNNKENIDTFNYVYSLEPLASIVLGIFFAFYLTRKKQELTREFLYKKVLAINYYIPVIFILFYFLFNSKNYIGILLSFMFFIYAYIEYFSMFYMRQVAQLDEYNNNQGNQLVCFNIIALNGLCPSILYITVYLLTHLTKDSLDIILFKTLVGLMLLSAIFNFSFKFNVKIR